MHKEPKREIFFDDHNGLCPDHIRRDDISITYVAPSDDVAKEVVEMSLGDRSTFGGTSFVSNPNAGRNTALVPAISDVLATIPKE